MAARVKAECDSLETIFQFKKRTWTRERWRHLKKSSFGQFFGQKVYDFDGHLRNGTEKLVMEAQSQ